MRLTVLQNKEPNISPGSTVNTAEMQQENLNSITITTRYNWLQLYVRMYKVNNRIKCLDLNVLMDS